MSQEDESGGRSKVLYAAMELLYWARNITAMGAIGYAVYALAVGGQWFPFFAGLAIAAACEALCWAPVLYMWMAVGYQRRRTRIAQSELRQLQLLNAQNELVLEQKRAHIAALKAEKAQLDALISALKTEALELERLQVQRRLEQEAREVRRKLDIAVASVEADILEAAAWRMDVTAKQLELKMMQADYFSCLANVEEDAQERILRAYEKGVEHGRHGLEIPAKLSRHLRIVEESA